MSEFTINNFVSLKLEDGKTNIYILGEEFIQCKYLLMNIPVQDIELYDEINYNRFLFIYLVEVIFRSIALAIIPIIRTLAVVNYS